MILEHTGIAAPGDGRTPWFQIANRKSQIANQKSKIKNQKSKISGIRYFRDGGSVLIRIEK
jgi:hypothetical protein